MNTNRAEYLPHEGVMLEEISSIIKDVPTGNFVDATYGYGSHFNLSSIHDHLNFIGFDRDLESINNSNNFQPLDMRMDMEQKLSAASIVNNYSEEKITEVLKAYSEDKHFNKISKKIIESRPLLTTSELVMAIKEALPRQNPIFTEKTIRRIFQALRIEVNDELNEIKASLNSIKKSIKKKGIIICISYHSLEDKIVKNFFNELTTFCICEPSIPICKCDIEQQFSYPSKKKYIPTEKEKESNPRSKSAIMRYVVKL